MRKTPRTKTCGLPQKGTFLKKIKPAREARRGKITFSLFGEVEEEVVRPYRVLLARFRLVNQSIRPYRVLLARLRKLHLPHPPPCVSSKCSGPCRCVCPFLPTFREAVDAAFREAGLPACLLP